MSLLRENGERNVVISDLLPDVFFHLMMDEKFGIHKMLHLLCFLTFIIIRTDFIQTSQYICSSTVLMYTLRVTFSYTIYLTAGVTSCFS